MRLVIAGGTRNVSAWLDAETPEERAALLASAARGEWTNGRGTEAIARLRTLSERLGYPVGDPNGPAAPPPCLVVVRHGERALYDGLTTIVRDTATVVWDRRLTERRKPAAPPSADRRRQDRRLQPSATWAHGFLVVPLQGGSASSWTSQASAVEAGSTSN